MPPDSPTPRRPRPIPLAVAGVSLLTLIISTILLAQRVRAYNESAIQSLFAYIQVNTPTFEFFGQRVELDETELDGRPMLRVLHGEDELLIPVAIETRQRLPELFARHADWMRMLFFADRSGMTMEQFERGIARDEIPARLIIVTRTPFGAEPRRDGAFGLEQDRNESSADVRRDRWLFDFYELDAEGGFTVHQPLRFPESGASLLRRQNQAKLRGEPIPEREPGELQERTWQYGAALKVMPRAPAITFENQALRAAGWTLPVASASVLGLVFGIFFAVAPERRRA
ncbi:MAG: hypothetical protein LAT64_01670 [Phycisphaerales bacterium]|nr:hypothetical protein [Planctomycetota bacterium]MCH8507471.1 hypothetical protein [Phycisphaerales bacterium]